jgi:hypothetical protein
MLELPGYRHDQPYVRTFHKRTLRTPPFNQIASGAVSEFLRAAKNQNLRNPLSGAAQSIKFTDRP